MTAPNTVDSLSIDYSLGRLQRDGQAPLGVVPVRWLEALVGELPPARAWALGEQWGAHLGEAVARTLGTATPTVQRSVDLLAREFALAGLGQLALEQWGRALVITLQGGPFEAGRGEFLAAVVQGMLGRAFERPVATLVLERLNGTTRVLVTAAAVVEWMRRGLEAGHSWSELVLNLHRGVEEN